MSVSRPSSRAGQKFLGESWLDINRFRRVADDDSITTGIAPVIENSVHTIGVQMG